METVQPPSVRRSLQQVRYEVLPLKGLDDQLPALPPGATVTVTSSPSKGIDATVDLATRLAASGFHVVPHLAGRLFVGPSQVSAVVERLADAGVREAFVVAGDLAEPAGPYEGALDLLRAMTAIDHPFARIGITGYPESHALISDATTIRAMADKAPHASYIVSQMCYDAAKIAGWIAAVRARGVTLPIHIGIPGAVDLARLMRVSLKVGLADSVGFMRKQAGVVGRLMTGYTPDDLVDGLAAAVANPAAGIAGWHLFTFNEIVKTEQWRRALLATAEGVTR